MIATQGNAPCCCWVPVAGTDGRVRMEMRWSTPVQAPTQAPIEPVTTPHAA